MKYIVEIENIKKKFGNVLAIDDVTLKVKQGEQVAIIGSSGSGKSTLLRCINHLEAIDSGRITINGEVLVETNSQGKAVYKSEEETRKLIMHTGMVFQHFNLFPHLNCLENITISPIRVKKENPSEAQERARELLKLVGLENKASAYPNQLSGGQKQRVAIARALAIRPSILLFDEPTSALDPEVMGEVLAAIRNLAKQGYTMILVTHEMGFAREVANRIIFMDNAKIIDEGTPEEVFGGAKSDRLQEFLRAVL